MQRELAGPEVAARLPGLVRARRVPGLEQVQQQVAPLGLAQAPQRLPVQVPVQPEPEPEQRVLVRPLLEQAPVLVP